MKGSLENCVTSYSMIHPMESVPPFLISLFTFPDELSVSVTLDARPVGDKMPRRCRDAK